MSKKMNRQPKPRQPKRPQAVIDSDALGVLCDSAEARLDQWCGAADGEEDPYANDCIYECEHAERLGIIKDLRAALEKAAEALKATRRR